MQRLVSTRLLCKGYNRMTANLSMRCYLLSSPEVIKGEHVRTLRRIHSGVILLSSFVTVKEKTLVVQ
jgi:hypothetical protein